MKRIFNLFYFFATCLGQLFMKNQMKFVFLPSSYLQPKILIFFISSSPSQVYVFKKSDKVSFFSSITNLDKVFDIFSVFVITCLSQLIVVNWIIFFFLALLQFSILFFILSSSPRSQHFTPLNTSPYHITSLRYKQGVC